MILTANDVHMVRCSNAEAQIHVGEFFKPIDSLSTTSPSTLLITGPAGVGKTALIQQSWRDNRKNATFKQLSPIELSEEEAGTVETNILNAFNPILFQQDGSSSRNHFVFIDDIHIWAPIQTSSSLQYRIIATLNDVIRNIAYTNKYSGYSHTIRFIASASSINSIHSSLVGNSAINYVICLSALSHSERKSWCYDALQSLYPQVIDHQKLLIYSHTLASMTPGFVHADMIRLFSSISRHSEDANFPEGPSELIQSPLIRDTCQSFTPLLVSQINPLLTRAFSTQEKLYGLEDQLVLIQQSLNTVFLECRTDVGAKDALSHGALALRTMGTLTGILIHGPTGCGKSTLLKKAVEVLPNNAVNVLPLDSASIVSSIIGQAERNLSSIFSVARMIAPSVIIIDNIDVLASRRDETNNDSSSSESFNRILSTLLVHIDGIKTESANNNLPVFIIATTRDFDLIDPALLRPGRIDVHVAVQPPNSKERNHIFNDILSEASHELNDRELIAKESKGWSTADVIACAQKKNETGSIPAP